MEAQELVFLAAAFFALATLYSSVGQAGASGYLAILALDAVTPDVMRPTALTLNVLVASVTVYRFRRAGLFSWNTLQPFLAGSLPMAAIGGALVMPSGAYYVVVGIMLLGASLILAWRSVSMDVEMQERNRVKRVPAVFIGAVIGLLSGITGIGGGIFLSPTLLLLNWADPKRAAGLSAPFILANSLVALASGSFAGQSLPAELPVLAGSAMAGALLGTWLALEKLGQKVLLLILSALMTLAGARLLLAA